MENQQSSFMREQSEEEREMFGIEPILRTANRDPREQESWQSAIEREYQAGYEGPYEGPAHIQSLGEKIVPRRSQQIPVSFWPRFMVIGILILALAGFMTGRYDGQQDMGYQGNNVYSSHWDRGYHERGEYGDRYRERMERRERYRHDERYGNYQGERNSAASDDEGVNVNDNAGNVHAGDQ